MEDFFLHYCLVEKLATKTLRTTYLAYPLREKQQKIIIKIYDQECVNQDQSGDVSRLNTLMAMDHPHIVPVLDIALEQGQPYVVSEYRAQGSLSRRLERLKRIKHKHMDWLEALSIVRQIGQALSYAHSHEIIHGNIKPENIFYKDNGEIQLADFNLSPFIDVTKLGYKADLHTIKYMAPEQFVGKTEKASDQYALACLAYELITGRPPFEGQSFSSMWGKHTTDYAAPLTSLVKLPMAVDVAILRALAKKGEDRHENMDAFLLALENALTPPAPEPVLELAPSVSTDPDVAKKPLITKPFGFTPFPLGPEEVKRSAFSEVLADMETREYESLIAIDPPSLSGLRLRGEGRKFTSQPGIQADTSRSDELDLVPGVGADLTVMDELDLALGIQADTSRSDELDLAPGIQADTSRSDELDLAPGIQADTSRSDELDLAPGMEADLALGAVADISMSDASEQVTNPLSEIVNVSPSRPYGQLIQRSSRATVPLNKLVTEAPEDNRPVAVVPPAVELRSKSSSRKPPVFWIGAVVIVLILLGALIPYLLNSSSSSQRLRTDIPHAVNTTDVNTTARAVVPDTIATSKTTRATQSVQSTQTPVVATKSPTPSRTVTPSSIQKATPTAVGPVIVPTSGSSHATAPAANPTPHGVGSVSINAGGDASGAFVGDEDFTSNVAGRPSSSSNSNDSIDTSGVVDPAPENVYQTYRVGDCTYTIPNLTVGASYTVRLHFAETYWTAVGQRTFNVYLNGQTVLSSFDIVAAAGGSDKAVVEQFVTKPNSDGTITIQFLTVHDNAQINGIEVLAN